MVCSEGAGGDAIPPKYPPWLQGSDGGLFRVQASDNGFRAKADVQVRSSDRDRGASTKQKRQSAIGALQPILSLEVKIGVGVCAQVGGLAAEGPSHWVIRLEIRVMLQTGSLLLNMWQGSDHRPRLLRHTLPNATATKHILPTQKHNKGKPAHQ